MELDIKTLNLESLPWLPMEENLSFPKKAAIYFAIDTNGVVQYIGRSVNPKSRWRQHHKFNDLKILGEIKISYLFVQTPDLLPEIEKALIAYFKPPLNKCLVPYTPVVRPPRDTMELPLVQDKLAPPSINIGSDAWFTWLTQNKSFRYRPSSEGYNYPRADITVRNRTKDYWYAYRKVNAVQRTYYLGKTKDLDFEKLQQAVDELSLSDSQYHKLIRDRRAGVHTKFVQPDASDKQLADLQEKYNQLAKEHQELEAKYQLLQEDIKGIAPRFVQKPALLIWKGLMSAL